MGQSVKITPKGLMVCNFFDPDLMGTVVASCLESVAVELRIGGGIIVIDDSVPKGTVKIWGEWPSP
jgi:hypothetical protein